MGDTSPAMARPITCVVGVFATEAMLEDAAGRLTSAGFSRAALSRPPAHVPPEEAPGRLDAAPVLDGVDRRQARTLGTSMSGALAGLAAAGVTIATGGAAAVAALAAVGAGGAAVVATAAVQRGLEETTDEENRAAAELGRLTLSVTVASPAQQAEAEAAMQAAGATDVLATATGARA